MVSFYHGVLCSVHANKGYYMCSCFKFQWNIITTLHWPTWCACGIWPSMALPLFHMGPYMSRSHQMYTCNTVCMHVCGGHIAYVSYGWVDIISCNTLLYYHFLYGWLTSVLTTQYLFVPLLYPCSVVVLFRCIYILYTSSNNSSSIL